MPRILVVDDDPAIRAALTKFLRGKRYEPLEAATGVEALRRLRADRPHLMLLDVTLPDASGLAVLQEAKTIDPGLGVIMVTGRHDQELRRQALQAGASDFVTKPIDLVQLERSLWYTVTTMTL